MINLQFLVNKLTATSQSATEAAAALCVARKHAEVEIEHVLLALVASPDCDMATLLVRYDLDPVSVSGELNHLLNRLPSGSTGVPALSQRLIRLLTTAWALASLEFGSARIRSAILILALLETEALLRPIVEISS